MGRQLPFEMPFETAFVIDDFLEAESNLDARRLLASVSEWPNRVAAIWGAAGGGKTHLAHIWASTYQAEFITMDRLRVQDAESAHQIVLDCSSGELERDLEIPLFHLLNMIRERGGVMLIVAREPPARWSINLPDLKSRLRALPVAEVSTPDDALLAAVLAKQCADRQLALAPETADYLLKRSERSFVAIRRLVERLDRLALERRRRKITTPMARAVFEDDEDRGSLEHGSRD